MPPPQISPSVLYKAKLENGTLRTEAGSARAAALDEALLTEDGLRLYPVEDGIPVMLADESVPLDRVDLPPA